ncbi:MAG: SDR family NAD(P)-dependent oxidoreductase [Acidobacteriota bacterium]|nr:SDR family NAD(P)-dependent oxidoreductase [Acidobacteriota bacterium]
MEDLRNKVAVITGGGEGIGRAIARRAAQAGMKLVLADIDAASLAATVAELTGQGAEAMGIPTDVASFDEVEALADAAFTRFHRVHLLVNNAGVALCKPAWELTLDDWNWVLGVNLHGVIHGIRAFVPRMLSDGEEGRIINTASAAGLLATPGFAAYSVSKHAVVALSEALHHDLALRESRLKVSALCPAWVKTRIAQSERNRDETERSEPGTLDPISVKIATAVLQATAAGITPDQVAEAVFEAIAADRFYILTHPETRSGVRVRMEDILQSRNPTLLSFDAGAGE